MISAIPTPYRGIMFRSRLEARWACFFDALHWPWHYEPIDLAGYCPNYIIAWPRPLLVEVKPGLSPDELQPHCAKIDRSGWEHEALIVGGCLMEPHAANPIVGLIREAGEWGEARLFECLSCGGASVLAADQSWRCRACGCEERHVSRFTGLASWVEAGNRVQWMPAA